MLSVLGRVAKGFSSRSKEYKTIEAAAHAVLFINQITTFAKFQKYFKLVGKEMTQKELKFLKQFGLKNER